jgi:hypothetical protein
MRVSRGGYPSPITSTEVDRYRAELTPGNLTKFLAKSQQSTDLNTPEKQGLSGFGCLSPRQPPPREIRAGFAWGWTKDLCRSWNVVKTLSPRLKVPQVREEDRDATRDIEDPIPTGEAPQWRHPTGRGSIPLEA